MPSVSINVLFTAFDVLMLVTTLGLLACWLVVLPRSVDKGFEHAVRRLTGVSIALLSLSSAGILVSRILELDGGSWGQLLASLSPALKFTHYGHVWVFRLPALALLWFGWIWCHHHRHHRWTVWLMAIAAAAIALTRSETGHPADHGDFTVAVWVDWLHLMAGSVWVGSLFGMSLGIFPRVLRTGAQAGADAALIFQRLSTSAGYALAVILLTGVFTAWQQLQNFSALWTSNYGRVLLVKIVLVGLMVALGAHNRYVKLPRLLRAAGKHAKEKLMSRMLGAFRTDAPSAFGAVARGCARAVHLESALGVGVVLAASLLLHGMPPVDMRSMPGMSMKMSAASPAASRETSGSRRMPGMAVLAALSPRDTNPTDSRSLFSRYDHDLADHAGGEMPRHVTGVFRHAIPGEGPNQAFGLPR